MNPDFDILILGAGLVGSSLACALDGRGYRIGLVEASLPRHAPPGFDERKLALAAASLNALQALGVLACLPGAPSPIQRIHVSREGDFGTVRLAAQDTGRESFGAVVQARELGIALESRLATLGDLQVLRPFTVIGVEQGNASVRVQLRDDTSTQVLSTRLLVAADGTGSFARRALRIGVEEHDYRQTLFVCTVATDRPADGTAYERFTHQGPVALLPMGRSYGAVCAVQASQASEVAALSDASFAEYFQQRFGWRAGRIQRVGARSAYPVKRVVAERIVAGRCVLAGNAAQTIHPIGAQGFNLGLRDALSLAELLDGGDPGATTVLQAYAKVRHEDRERTLAFSDGLARVTSNEGLPMQVLRSIGLLGLGNFSGLAAPLVAGAMGFRGRVPVLARARP